MARGGKRKGAGDKPGHPYRGGGGRQPNGPPYYPWVDAGISRRTWYANDYHRLSSEEQIATIHRRRAKPPKRTKPVEIKIPAERRYGVDRRDVGKLREAALFDQQKERRKAEREEYMSQPLVGKPCKRCGQRGLFCSC
jgi:hypothetical protein